MGHLGIALTTYRRPTILKRLLNQIESIKMPDGWDFTCYVIWSGWSDATQACKDLYNEFSGRPPRNAGDLLPARITFTLNDFNWHFSRQINMGLVLSWLHDYCLILTDDIEVIDEDCLVKMIKLMEDNPKVASLGTVSLLPNGDVYCSGGQDNNCHYHDRINEPRIVCWNNFAVCLLRMSVVHEIGLLKQDVHSYHFYASDREWTERASSHGYINMVGPVEWLHHHRSPYELE